MALPLYLAMTAAEIQENAPLPTYFSYMACHFSPYGTGLSNLPPWLPKHTLLILNDRIPIHGHDPRRITNELTALATEFMCSGILLDFQRERCQEVLQLVTLAADMLPCPVAVPPAYASDCTCPVFLPPIPPDMAPEDYLRPWKGREIWLEVSLECLALTITPSGCKTTPCSFPDNSKGIPCRKLYCHYQIITEADQAKFILFRTRNDLDRMLNTLQSLGISRAVGLWQELSE